MAVAGASERIAGRFLDIGGGIINVKHPDINANGSGDATDKIQYAFDLGTAQNAWIDLCELTHYITGPLTAGANLKVQNGRLDFSDYLTSGPGISSIGGGFSSPISVTAEVLHGDITIDVADASSFAAGDWLMLASQERWGTIIAAASVTSEMVCIHSIMGNTLILYDSIDYNYVMGDTPTVSKLTFLGGWHFRNVDIVVNPEIVQSALRGWYLKGAKFENINTYNARSRGLGFSTCLDIGVFNPRFEAADPLFSGGLNYGVVWDSGCHDCRTIGGSGHNLRHVVTIGGSTYINRHILTSNMQSKGATDAGFDSHSAADHVTFQNLQVFRRPDDSTALEGVIAQCARVKIDNVEIHGKAGAVGVGIRWQPIIAANVPLMGQITNIQASGECNIVVKVHQISTTPIVSLQIGHVQFSGAAGHCQFVLDVDVEDSDLKNFSISDINGDGIEDRGIYIHCAGSVTVSHGTLNGGTLVMENGSNSAIRLAAGGLNLMEMVQVSNFVLDGGEWGINAPDTGTQDYITIGLNTYRNQVQGPYNIVGANSKVAAVV